jgi:hypothetical protein
LRPFGVGAQERAKEFNSLIKNQLDGIPHGNCDLPPMQVGTITPKLSRTYAQFINNSLLIGA